MFLLDGLLYFNRHFLVTEVMATEAKVVLSLVRLSTSIFPKKLSNFTVLNMLGRVLVVKALKKLSSLMK